MIWHKIAIVGGLLFLAASCQNKSESKDASASDPSNDDTGDGGNDGGGNGGNEPQEGEIAITGSLAVQLALLNETTVTHVVAVNPANAETVMTEVAEDGTFSLPVATESNWVLTYVDANQSGSEMVVGTFSAGELDSIATSEESENIELGSVEIGETAQSETAEADILAAMGLSEAAAETYGAVDDISLRYSNPDVNNDGEIDAVGELKFPLDFHNRFNMRNANGDELSIAAIKNQFLPADSQVHFTGSGIIPWLEEDAYSQTVGAYTWKFSSDVVMGSNGGGVCDGLQAGDTLPAGTACAMDLANGGQTVAGYPSIELAAAVDGDYTVEAGGGTFTWTNIKAADFSVGEGFIALFLRLDVDDQERLTGVSYKWQKKSAEGTYVAATAEELSLLINSSGGYLSFKVDGNNSGKGLGAKIPLKPSGSLVFADEDIAVQGSGEENGKAVSVSGDLEPAEVKAGIDWSRITENPGISYDDKLGMRFFFGYNAPIP